MCKENDGGLYNMENFGKFLNCIVMIFLIQKIFHTILVALQQQEFPVWLTYLIKKVKSRKSDENGGG